MLRSRAENVLIDSLKRVFAVKAVRWRLSHVTVPSIVTFVAFSPSNFHDSVAGSQYEHRAPVRTKSLVSSWPTDELARGTVNTNGLDTLSTRSVSPVEFRSSMTKSPPPCTRSGGGPLTLPADKLTG